MPRYRKKPVVIEAAQWLGDDPMMEIANFPEPILAILREARAQGAHPFKVLRKRDGRASVEIHTLEGKMRLSPGDWLIRGVRGELYPCKPDIFTETYERVED